MFKNVLLWSSTINVIQNSVALCLTVFWNNCKFMFFKFLKKKVKFSKCSKKFQISIVLLFPQPFLMRAIFDFFLKKKKNYFCFNFSKCWKMFFCEHRQYMWSPNIVCFAISLTVAKILQTAVQPAPWPQVCF